MRPMIKRVISSWKLLLLFFIPRYPDCSTWGYGDASTVTVYDTDLCKVGD
ncbi:hypothetical protein ACLHDG_07255 [Sulfurovum sp. CS9]